MERNDEEQTYSNPITRKRIVWVAVTALVIVLGRLLLATADIPNQDLIKDVLWVLGSIVISYIGGAAAIDALRKR